jgi:hypothetical protein
MRVFQAQISRCPDVGQSGMALAVFGDLSFFLVQVAKRMDPFSIDRMLVAGDAYRANELAAVRRGSDTSRCAVVCRFA